MCVCMCLTRVNGVCVCVCVRVSPGLVVRICVCVHVSPGLVETRLSGNISMTSQNHKVSNILYWHCHDNVHVSFHVSCIFL